MTRTHRLRDTLTEAFQPARLEILDESAKHAGHTKRMGVAEGGETHFQVVMVSESFTGLSRVARSRAVHEALDAEFKSGLHALSLTLQTPAEASKAA